jgi:hypothetical protein
MPESATRKLQGSTTEQSARKGSSFQHDRRLGVPQLVEANKLVCDQFALFIAPDKTLNMAPLSRLMNCSEQDRRPKNGRSIK